MYIRINNEHTAVFCNPHLMSANVIKNITAKAGFAGNNKKSKAKTTRKVFVKKNEFYVGYDFSEFLTLVLLIHFSPSDIFQIFLKSILI